jgi:hypothetical protein
MDDAPVPPPLHILRCEHSLEAHVKQSRHPSTPARAYYCCRYTVVNIQLFSLIEVFIYSPLDYFNVIEIIINFTEEAGAYSFSGLMNQRCLTHKFFFSSYDDNQSFPYHNFQRWVAPPPNPPPMSDEEKEEATTHHVSHPSLCKCGYRS